jgi:hypothetical protein
MSTLPSPDIGADVLETMFSGRFSALGTKLQNLEAIAVRLFTDPSHNKTWRTGLSLDIFRAPENVYVRAQNLVAIRISGDTFSSAESSPAFQALERAAQTLRVTAADNSFYAFTYNPSEIILKLGKIPRGPLYGAELLTDGIPVSGLLKDRAGVAKAIKLSGVVRELQDSDEIVQMLTEGWVWQNRWKV